MVTENDYLCTLSQEHECPCRREKYCTNDNTRCGFRHAEEKTSAKKNKYIREARWYEKYYKYSSRRYLDLKGVKE